VKFRQFIMSKATWKAHSPDHVKGGPWPNIQTRFSVQSIIRGRNLESTIIAEFLHICSSVIGVARLLLRPISASLARYALRSLSDDYISTKRVASGGAIWPHLPVSGITRIIVADLQTLKHSTHGVFSK
jgi:hypothetical protein